MSEVYVAPLSLGLGDLVVSLPAIQGLIRAGARSGDPTWLVARSAGQADLATRIMGLAGSVDEDSFDRCKRGRRFVDLRDHPLQRDHWWGSFEFDEEFGELSINDILSRICVDFGIDADFSRPRPLMALPRPDVHDVVILVATSDGPTRHWPVERWASLADELRASGVDVRVLSRDAKECELGPTQLEAVAAPTLGDVVDVLASCRAVIGVDTGPTHIAVQQGTPTVTLCRQRPVYFRPWPHCRAVVGSRCDEACVANEREYAYNAQVSLRGFQWSPRVCPVSSRCIEAIQPPQVIDALQDVL